MICKFVHKDSQNWDKLMDHYYLQFRKGMLDVIKENSEDGPVPINEVQYILNL